MAFRSQMMAIMALARSLSPQPAKEESESKTKKTLTFDQKKSTPVKITHQNCFLHK